MIGAHDDENDDCLKAVLADLNHLLHLAKHKHIGAVVLNFNNVRIDVLSSTTVEKCIQWVTEQTRFVEEKQLLFLCLTLGYIAYIKQTYCLPLRDDDTTKYAFDKLLQNLQNCFKRKFPLPDNCWNLLERSAFTLVQGCSRPGWLTFAAYFRPFFGMKYVLNVRMESCKYDKEEYFKLLSLLVFGVKNIKKASWEERQFFRPFLKCILQFAPDEDVLFQMVHNKDVYRFFYSQNEREQFFMEIFMEFLNKQTQNLGDTLKHIIRITENFSGKMSGISGIIYGYVQQFIDNVAEPSADEMAAVFHLISEYVSDDKVFYLLRHLSKSLSATHHNLFLQLLNDERFGRQWEKVLRSEKVKICFSWVEMKANSSKEKSGRIKAIFETVDILISCALISSNKNLIQALCENVFKGLLNEDCIRIFEEFKDIENYSLHVQNWFQRLVEEILYRSPHLVTKREVLNSFYGNTR